MSVDNVEDLRKAIRGNSKVSQIEDFGILISYSNKIVDEFIDKLIFFRSVDTYSQAERLLRTLLENIFDLDEFITGIYLTRSIGNLPETLSIFIRERGKKAMKMVKKDSKKWFKESGSEISMSAEMLSYLSNEFYDMAWPDYEDKEEQAKYFKMEIDAVINIGNNRFAPIEAKMFTCPINDEGRILKRLLAPSEINKYIGSRKSFYFLMGFSFFYDENRLIEDDNEEIKEYPDFYRNLPAPLWLDALDLGDSYSSWIFHLCILDKRIFKSSLWKTTDKPEKSSDHKNRKSFSEYLTNLILKEIHDHQQFFLKKLQNSIKSKIDYLLKSMERNNFGEEEDISDEISNDLNKNMNYKFLSPEWIVKTYSGIELNICLNYNLLKVHYMSGHILELKNILKQQQEQMAIQYKKYLEERRARLEERKEKLRERKERLELEVKFVIKDNEEKKVKLEEIKNINEEIGQIKIEIEKVSEQLSNFKIE